MIKEEEASKAGTWHRSEGAVGWASRFVALCERKQEELEEKSRRRRKRSRGGGGEEAKEKKKKWWARKGNFTTQDCIRTSQ